MEKNEPNWRAWSNELLKAEYNNYKRTHRMLSERIEWLEKWIMEYEEEMKCRGIEYGKDGYNTNRIKSSEK